MFSRKWVINGILAILLAFSMVNVFQSLNTKIDILPKTGHAAKGSGSANFSKKRMAKIPSESRFKSIVDKDLFSPDRKVFKPEAQETAPVLENVKISGKKVVLYGVIITDGYKAALINNPEKRTRSDADNRWVREGDSIGNLKIIKINSDEISLNDGVNNYRISLYDPNKSSKVQSAHNRRDDHPEQPKVVINAGDESVANNKKPSQKAGKINQPDDNAKYEYIDTPFGKVMRKIK